ncbi:flippase [Vibrio breoganii]
MTTSNRFLKNTLWIILNKVFRSIFSIFILAAITRHLGPESLGNMSYALSFTVFITALATLGLKDTLVNEIVDRKSEQGAVVGTSIVMRLLSSSVSSVVLFAILYYLDLGNDEFYWMVFVFSLSLVFQSFDMITLWYLSQLRSKVVSILTTVTFFISVLIKCLLLYLDSTVIWFAFVTMLEQVLTGLTLYIYSAKYDSFKLSFDSTLIKPLLKKSNPYIVSGLMVAIYAQTDRVMLGNILGSHSVGLYSSALAICTMWTFLLAAIVDSSRPIIFKAHQEDYSLFALYLRRLYASVIWISLIVATVISLFSEDIIILLYGEEFLDAITVLRIVSWSTAFSFLGVAKSLWLLSENCQNYEKWFTGIGVIVNISLNYLLIPKWGVEGAAVATLVTQFSSNFLAQFFMKKTKKNGWLILQAFFIYKVLSISETKAILKRVSGYFRFYKL